MKKRSRILATCLVVIATAFAVFAFALSHNAPCTTQSSTAGTRGMKAIVYRCYGSPEVLHVEEVAKPVPADDQVLVRVRAASVNPLDWHYMRGEPYIMRLGAGFGSPNDIRMGVDYAGTVEAVGKGVTRFKPGDEVFGGRSGALAEYVTARESGSLAIKPGNITFEQAAAIPIAAITALQALRDKGRLRPGQKVLINGASGGVGTYAVQIAKAFGAEVTGVCSTRNVELVRSLGADHVIDYTREDFTQLDPRYDLIVDNVGNHPLLARTHVLQPGGVLVIVGGQNKDPWLGPMMDPLKSIALSPFVKPDMVMILAELNHEDLDVLAGFIKEGKVTPVIDRLYAFDAVPAAIEYLETGHARGKVVIQIADETVAAMNSGSTAPGSGL